MHTYEHIDVLPATTSSERLTYKGLLLKIILGGSLFDSAKRGIVFDGSIRGFVNDSLSSLYGKGGAISSLRMMSEGILITESAWTNPLVREMGINTALYDELVNTYFPQVQIVGNFFGTYGGINARLIISGKMSAKQRAFYRLGWANYRGRHSLADFFVRPGANPSLINFPHMYRIF